MEVLKNIFSSHVHLKVLIVKVMIFIGFYMCLQLLYVAISQNFIQHVNIICMGMFVFIISLYCIHKTRYKTILALFATHSMSCSKRNQIFSLKILFVLCLCKNKDLSTYKYLNLLFGYFHGHLYKLSLSNLFIIIMASIITC